VTEGDIQDFREGEESPRGGDTNRTMDSAARMQKDLNLFRDSIESTHRELFAKKHALTGGDEIEIERASVDPAET
jgi:hypothetical protein